jgi:hypothetical protein
MDRKSCRNCKLFIRIKEIGKIRPRGFCVVGQCDGSFGLYISSSVATDCMGYNNGNNHILKLEDELGSISRLIIHKYEDKVFEGEYEVEDVFRAREIGYDEFLKKYEDDIKKLEGYCKCTQERYNEVMKNLSFKMREMVGGLL